MRRIRVDRVIAGEVEAEKRRLLASRAAVRNVDEQIACADRCPCRRESTVTSLRVARPPSASRVMLVRSDSGLRSVRGTPVDLRLEQMQQLAGCRSCQVLTSVTFSPLESVSGSGACIAGLLLRRSSPDSRLRAISTIDASAVGAIGAMINPHSVSPNPAPIHRARIVMQVLRGAYISQPAASRHIASHRARVALFSAIRTA